jgi:hypothetical protein
MGDVTPGRRRRGPGPLELGLSVLAALVLFAFSLLVPFITVANATRQDNLAACARGGTIAAAMLALVVWRAVVVAHPGTGSGSRSWHSAACAASG